MQVSNAYFSGYLLQGKMTALALPGKHLHQFGPGNFRIESQVLQVLAPAGPVGLSGLAFASNVVTPNGDGVHDAVVANFEVLRMDGPQSVVGTVYDLSGRRVWRTAELRERASGHYTVAWSGVDEAGALVSPGVYLLRLEVRADADVATTLVRPVYVAY